MSTKSGLADSPFFAPLPKKEPTVVPSPAIEKPNDTNVIANPLSPIPKSIPIQEKRPQHKKIIDKTLVIDKPQAEKNDDMNANMQASNNASMLASNQPFNQETIIETIRKAVKDVGKDSATYRFMPEEKKALLELCFSYKMQGYKTSENEFIRIAVNYLLEDQKQNGRNSVIQRVLDALNK